MRPLLVLSIQHTGTFFTYYLMPGRNGQRGTYRDGHKYWAHYGEPGLAEAMERCFTVVPRREYAEVQKSWARRKMDLDELATQWSWYDTLRDVFFLQIDAPDRDQQLLNLSMQLGHPLSTDWKPTNCLARAA